MAFLFCTHPHNTRSAYQQVLLRPVRLSVSAASLTNLICLPNMAQGMLQT